MFDGDTAQFKKCRTYNLTVTGFQIFTRSNKMQFNLAHQSLLVIKSSFRGRFCICGVLGILAIDLIFAHSNFQQSISSIFPCTGAARLLSPIGDISWQLVIIICPLYSC